MRRTNGSLRKPINPGDIGIGVLTVAGPRQLQQTGKSKGSCNFMRTTGASLVAKWRLGPGRVLSRRDCLSLSHRIGIGMRKFRLSAGIQVVPDKGVEAVTVRR